MFRHLLRFNNLFKWITTAERGMNTYCDILDWYGGLPYDAAGVDETVEFAQKNNLTLQNAKTFMKEGKCNIYLLKQLGN
jgi:2-polyprenyl-6-hydroxyphenyl methylase/3-demethylubiquinone-9 3-methyltransferase